MVTDEFDKHVWHPIDETPFNLKGVLFGNWFEDRFNGFFGKSGWLWIASGYFVNGEVFIDKLDSFQRKTGIGLDVPTHWRIMPFLGPFK